MRYLIPLFLAAILPLSSFAVSAPASDNAPAPKLFALKHAKSAKKAKNQRSHKAKHSKTSHRAGKAKH
jgi:hypothetical protein